MGHLDVGEGLQTDQTVHVPASCVLCCCSYVEAAGGHGWRIQLAVDSCFEETEQRGQGSEMGELQ